MKNWRPLSLTQIASSEHETVGGILGELTTVATLRIYIRKYIPFPSNLPIWFSFCFCLVLNENESGQGEVGGGRMKKKKKKKKKKPKKRINRRILIYSSTPPALIDIGLLLMLELKLGC